MNPYFKTTGVLHKLSLLNSVGQGWSQGKEIVPVHGRWQEEGRCHVKSTTATSMVYFSTKQAIIIVLYTMEQKIWPYNYREKSTNNICMYTFCDNKVSYFCIIKTLKLYYARAWNDGYISWYNVRELGTNVMKMSINCDGIKIL